MLDGATEATAIDPAPTPAAAHNLLASFRAHLGALGAEVDRLRQDADFLAALDAMARFWRYSPSNQWFIRRARPDATFVGGRRVWASLGRRVKDGERPIEILAPMSRAGFPFRVVEVFDVRQTRGRRLPTFDLRVRGRTRKVAWLEAAAARLGVRVVELRDRPELLGCSVGGEIRIRRGLAQRERAAVLAHELAHEFLHQRDARGRRSHAERETEAEATAYVVLRALGLPSKAPRYIAWQGGSGALIARSLGRIGRASRLILDAAMAPTT